LIKVQHLNNPDLKGSSIIATKSLGNSLGVDVTNSFENKFELKIGFNIGTFRQNIDYYASSDFLTGDFNYNHNSTLMPFGNTFFGELSLGPNLPLQLSQNSKLNLSVNAKVSYINSEDILIDRGSFIETPEGPIETKFITGELDFQNEEQMQLGFGSEIIYELLSAKRPIGFQLGIIGTYTPKPYLTGNIELIGDDDQLKTKITARQSYVGLKFDVSFELK